MERRTSDNDGLGVLKKDSRREESKILKERRKTMKAFEDYMGYKNPIRVETELGFIHMKVLDNDTSVQILTAMNDQVCECGGIAVLTKRGYICTLCDKVLMEAC